MSDHSKQNYSLFYQQSSSTYQHSKNNNKSKNTKSSYNNNKINNNTHLSKLNPIVPKPKNNNQSTTIPKTQMQAISISIEKQKQFQTQIQVSSQTDTENLKAIKTTQYKNIMYKNDFNTQTHHKYQQKLQKNFNKSINNNYQQRKLNLYHCDSIAIRPSNQSWKVNYKKTVNQSKNTKTKILSSSQETQNQNTIRQICKQLQQKKENVGREIKKRKSIFGNLTKSVALQNLQKSRIQKTHIKNKLPQYLQQGHFHIQIDTDQITQCCM